jgi:DNA-binding NtrC family response regulator
LSRSILLIDDDAEVLALLGRFFEQKGWFVLRAMEAAGAAAIYDRERPDLVLLDVDLPGISGLRLLEVLRVRDADATIVMLTGNADIPTAVEAIRLGAENFLTKPIELTHLEAAAERAWEKVELRRRNHYFAHRQPTLPGLEAIGRSSAMRDVARQVELMAASDRTVLLMGETGTGKGWIAQMLHAMSARSDAPFVEINCAGLSTTFLDSELFGHEKGAFTDAKQRKPGLLEVASPGTVFLDEVGDLSADLQPKLLKVLETKRFRRLGGTHEIEADVRLITATNRDLDAAVRDGTFREDLYYRLAVLPLRLPPLRERSREDIADLALMILADTRRLATRGPSRISAEALDRITRYAWPGNIRELRNVLERVTLLAGDAEEVQPGHLPPEIGAGSATETTDTAQLSLEEVERRHIARVLAHHGGNRSRTARTLGISRATLYEKLTRYGLADIGVRRLQGRGTRPHLETD